MAVAAIALFFVGPLAQKAEEPSILAQPISLPSEAEADSVPRKSIDVAFEEPEMQAEQPEESLSFKATQTSKGHTPETTSAPRPPVVSTPPRPVPMASPPAPPSISEPPQVFPEATAVSEPTEDGAERWDGADLGQWRGTHGEYLVSKVSKCFPELFGESVARAGLG